MRIGVGINLARVGVLGGDFGVSLGPGGLGVQAAAYLGGITPYHWLDFINNRALYASVDVGNVTGATGYSFTRASDGYYQNSDGTLTNFASGALRRGDRGVLIEGSRTNLLVRSQEFSNPSWTTNNVAVTDNSVTAPNGTLTAAAAVFSGTISSDRIFQNTGTNAANGTAVTGSIWMRADSPRTVTLNVERTGPADNENVVVSLTTSWQRFTFTHSTTWTGATALRLSVSAISSVGTIYLWGAQLEAASFASSYVPTVAASATRAADSLSYTAGVSYPIQLWSEFERAVDTGGTESLIAADAGADAAQALLYVHNTDVLRAFLGNTTTQADVAAGSAISVGVTVKGAARFATDDVNAVRSGTLGTSDTSATVPTNPTILRVGGRVSAANPPFGYIRRIAVIQGAGTDAQLQSMTGS
jgi:hypothetical protein